MARSRMYSTSGERDYNPTGVFSWRESARKQHSTFSRRNQAARYRAGRAERYPGADNSLPTGNAFLQQPLNNTSLLQAQAAGVVPNPVNPLANALRGINAGLMF